MLTEKSKIEFSKCSPPNVFVYPRGPGEPGGWGAPHPTPPHHNDLVSVEIE